MMGTLFGSILATTAALSFIGLVHAGNHCDIPLEPPIATKINCQMKKPFHDLYVPLNLSGTNFNSSLKISFVWPLFTCSNLPKMIATIEVFLTDAKIEKNCNNQSRNNKGPYFKRTFSMQQKSNNSREGTLEVLELQVGRGCYYAKLKFESLQKSFESQNFFMDTYHGNQSINVTYDSKETLTREHGSVLVNFGARITPKVDPTAIIYVHVLEQEPKSDTCFCEEHCANNCTIENTENALYWNFLQNKPGNLDTKGPCSMNEEFVIRCEFGRFNTTADKLYAQLFIIGDDMCSFKNGTQLNTRCCFNFQFNITDINELKGMGKPGADFFSIAVIVFSIIASIVIIFLLAKNRDTIRKLFTKNFELTASNQDHVSQPLMSLEEKSRLNIKILLIYSKKSIEFMEAIQGFKEYLCSEFKSGEVIDVYHEDYERQLNIEGLSFITRFTREKDDVNLNVKIILIHTDETLDFFQKCQADGNLDAEEHEVIRIVYNDLTQQPRQLRYNKVYNVFFDKFPLSNPYLRPKFNALTNYKYPQHALLLCRDLCKGTEVVTDSEATT